MPEIYKQVVASALFLAITWTFALLVAGLLIWWEKSTKGALWRYWDR